MKRILALLLVCAMLALAGCEEKENKPESGTNKEIIYSLPSIDADDVEVEEAEYSRFGGKIVYSNVRMKKFDERFKEADVSVKVKITKYLGVAETKYETDNTLFKAKVLVCYKGDVKPGDDIYLIQYGSPLGTMSSESTLFGIADILTLNLISYTDDRITTQNHYYEIMNLYAGIIESITYEGVEYAIIRAPYDYLNNLRLTPVDDVLCKKVFDYYVKCDSYRNNIVNTIGNKNVYKYSDIQNAIIDLMNKEK